MANEEHLEVLGKGVDVWNKLVLGTERLVHRIDLERNFVASIDWVPTLSELTSL